MNPPYPDPSGNYVPNQINYDVTGNANERIIVDPSFNLNYESQSCILRPKLSQNIGINNNYDARYSFNRTINLDLFSGFQYPVKFSLDYDTGDCINASNDLQSKYAFPSIPFNIALPEISGVPTYIVGSRLTCSTGTWGGTPIITFTYQWYRGATQISGAINHTYTIVGSDIQQLITCEVTGINSSGYTTATSSNIITPSDPPDNITRPTISGSASVDSILSISTTELWSGYPAPTLTYQWYRVDTPIPSATNNSYTIVTDDVGQSITCRVKGTNTSGSFTAISINSITPTGPPGINNNNDTLQISGISPYSVGSTLTLSNPGTWTGYPAPTLTYQWYRGDAPIPSATNNSYIIQASDVGQSITCHVTGTNTNGSVTAISKPITPIIPPSSPPQGAAPPQISGISPYYVGSTLTTTNGSWNGYPAPTFTYQWYRGYTLIPSATNNSYIIQDADVGQSITCVVTATNTSGWNGAQSNNWITPTRSSEQ